MTQSQGKPLGCFMKGCLFLVLHPIWIGLLLGGLYYAYDSYTLTSKGVEIDSVMVDTDIHHDRNGATTYSPIYEYTYHEKTYRYNSVNSSSDLPHNIGDHVMLVIDPSNPEHARTSSFDELWMLPSILVPVGLCLGVLMTVLGTLASRFGRMTSLGHIQVNR